MEKPHTAPPIRQVTGPARWALFAFGWINVATGFAGVFVPGLPTTVFMLIALWAFSRSSPRFQLWLWTHPRFGPVVRDWHAHKVIPPQAKVAAVATMTLSVIIVSVFVAQSWKLPVIMAAVMTPIGGWIVTRASRVPDEVGEELDLEAAALGRETAVDGDHLAGDV